MGKTNVFISAKSSVVSKRAYGSHKRASEPYQRREKREKRVHKRQNIKQRVVGKRASEPYQRREKRGKRVHKRQNIKQRVVGKRAYESQKRAYEPHKRREKREKREKRENGKNVFKSVKSSVVGKRAYESQKRAYYESQKCREKREKQRNWIRGRLETRIYFQPHQSTRQQDSRLVRVMLCLRGKRKAQNYCLNNRIFVKYTTSRTGTLEILKWFSPVSQQEMCFARFNSVLTSLPPLPFHSFSTPSPLPLHSSFLDVRIPPPGRSYGPIAVRPWRVVCVTANMQCAVPLSLLFSFLAPPAMLRTDCLLLCTQRGAGAQPRQQDVRASSNCSLESKSSAFSSSDPMLPPALRCLPQHGRYEHAVSFAAGVRAGGWRGAGERAFN